MELVVYRILWPVLSVRKTLRALICHFHDHFIPHPRNNYHPHILGHRTLGLFSGLLVAFKIFILATVSLGPVLPALSSAITSGNIINLTNQSRIEYQLQNLRESPVLAKAAQAKADDMLAKGYFSHNSPDGRAPWDFIVSAGYNYLAAGENLAVNFTEAENVEAAWMNSPGHKANILNKDFEEIGIGIAQGEYQGHTAIFVVQMFGSPVDQPVKVLEKPTVVQKETVPEPVQSATLPKAEVSAQALELSSPKTEISGQDLKISVEASPEATKVLANFGPRGIMLEPKADNLWQGSIPFDSLTGNNANLVIEAFNISGQSQSQQVAHFSGSTPANYSVLGASTNFYANWLGKVFDPKAFENKFYLLFIAGMLVSLILAIAIRRHVQHLSLVMNSSFVIILATMLWFAG